jgi:iron complex transport system substrate-binding protein
MWARVLGAAMAFIALAAWAAPNTIEVRDDANHLLRFSQPAKRVISLAPHTTELLFAAGAKQQVLAVSAFSDFPAAARALPQIGDSRQLDIERILALKPDLLVVWGSGTPARQLAQLQKLGIPMFYSEPRKLADIADSILRLGRLLGSTAQAQETATQLQTTLADIARQYSTGRVVRLFYAISDNPLYTLNGQHIVNDAFMLCGAQNVFAALPVLAPAVSIEAVLEKNPEAIIVHRSLNSSNNNPNNNPSLSPWQQFPALLAVQRNNIIPIEGHLLTRSGPRMIDGVRLLCEKLDRARHSSEKH